MPIKRTRELKVSAHLLIYSFLFFKLLLGFGLDFKFGLGLRLGLDLEVEFELGLGLRLGLESDFLFLRNVIAASAFNIWPQIPYEILLSQFLVLAPSSGHAI